MSAKIDTTPKTKAELEELSNTDLVAYFNAITGKSIKKFASKKSGVSRTLMALQAAGTAAPKADKKASKKKASKAPAKKAEPADPAETHARRSAGIKQSWTDPDTRAARTARHPVKVQGHGEFRSVRAAFEALGLPDVKHQAFRKQLVNSENGRATFEGHVFRLA